MIKIKWAAFQPLIGGMVLGFEKAIGHKPEFLLSYEGFQNNEKHLLKYWPDVPYFILKSDDTFLKEEDKKKFENLNKNIDIMCGVPICAGLSMLNNCVDKNSNMSRGCDAIQNNNMYNIISFVDKHINPKVACYENAPNLYTNAGKKVREKINNLTDKAILYYKTNTIFHGIPQKRERTFVFLFKNEKTPILSWYDEDFVCITKFLSNIDKSITHHNILDAKNKLKDNFYYKFIVEHLGENFRNILYSKNIFTAKQYAINIAFEDAKKYAEKEKDEFFLNQLVHCKNKVENGKGFWDSSVLLTKIDEKNRHYVNSVISKNISSFIHPKEDRLFTIREYMRLMGLPDNFNLVDEKRDFMHITQNVPVNTASSMGLECVKYINNQLQFKNTKLIMQNNITKKIDLCELEIKNNLQEFFK